jgi:hypothetical protein
MAQIREVSVNRSIALETLGLKALGRSRRFRAELRLHLALNQTEIFIGDFSKQSVTKQQRLSTSVGDFIDAIAIG